ncbi:hypothetical protein [Simkania negevensis]|uniref:Type III secretion translocator protein n=1 Tax=Simkania negevensis (strain ATCC VR-1471 / DSM 27360 / Z) TaxID=331113 RepID=F8L3Q0_SIMNZ|nr:hypothetical protein [Simkania negevensis]CCB89912.1 type III secretion translocator protein [Simkania negevensis Z]
MTTYTIQRLENEALNNQFISQDEQSKKKQIHLASLATTLKTALHQATPKTDNDSHESLQKAMAEMQAILSELMGHFTEIQEQLQNGQLQMGQTMATASEEENLQKLNETTKQIDKNERHEKLQKVFKALEIIGTVIFSAIAILTGNPEVAIALIAMTIFSSTGGMSKLTSDIAKGIASGLEAAGVNSDVAQKVANVLAAAVVIVATVVATLGAGAIGGAAISTASSFLEDASEEGTSMTSQLIDGAKSGFKNASKIAIMNGTQATIGTNAIVDIFEAMAVNSSNPKVKEAMEILGEIVQIIVAIIGMVAGGSGSAAEDSESSLVNLAKTLGTKLANSSEKLSTLMTMIQDAGTAIGTKLSGLSAAKLQALVTSASLLAQGLPAIPEIWMGSIDIQLGKMEEILSQLNANINQLKNETELNQASIKQVQDETKEILQSFANLIQNVGNYIAPMQAGANVVAQGI